MNNMKETKTTTMSLDRPSKNCRLCADLAAFADENRRLYPDFFNAPVPSFGPLDAALLIVGLAPGLKGANKTGRPFTGDFAGDVLYAALKRKKMAFGTYAARADDGLTLSNVRITNAVRCVPPQNKVNSIQTKTCSQFLISEIDAMPRLKAILALGAVAHGAVLSALGQKKNAFPFAHNARHMLAAPRPLILVDSYHTSRYNVNTGVLTEEMFDNALQTAVDALS